MSLQMISNPEKILTTTLVSCGSELRTPAMQSSPCNFAHNRSPRWWNSLCRIAYQCSRLKEFCTIFAKSAIPNDASQGHLFHWGFQLGSCWLKTFALDLQHNLCRFWLFILTLFFLPGILYTHVSVLCCQSTILYNVTSRHLQTRSKLSTFYKFGSPPKKITKLFVPPPDC